MTKLTYLIDTVQVGDDIESDLRTLILQLGQEQWQKVLDSAKQ